MAQVINHKNQALIVSDTKKEKENMENKFWCGKDMHRNN